MWTAASATRRAGLVSTSVPRVLAIPGDRNGPALWRILQVFAELQRHGYPAEWCPKDDPRLGAVAVQYRPDLVILPRLSWLSEDRAKAERFVGNLHAAGVAVCYEVDDELFSEHVVARQLEHAGMTKGHTAAELEAERLARLHALGLCDGVTVSTPRLATVARAYTNAPVHVVENAIDLPWWRAVQRHAERLVPGLTIGWAGGARPDADVQAMAEAWVRLAARYPAVTFVVQGHQPKPLEALPPDRVRRVPWLPLESYPLGLAGIDIGCCPLGDTAFNRCKSPIKAFEYAASGAAVVASPTVYRTLIEPGETGYLCETADEWEAALSALIESESRRRIMARRLLRKVERQHSLSVNAWRWPAAWSSIVATFRARLLLAA